MKINEQIGKPQISFSPSFYKNALRQFNEGYMRDLIALMEEAARDSHATGCLTGRMAGFSGDWRITPFSESAGDIEIAGFVKDIFLETDMQALAEDIFDARLKKFSVIALDWQVSGGMQRISGFRKINQRFFRYDKPDGRLMIDMGNRLIPVPGDSALVCESKKTPVLLPVVRDFILKEFGLSNWASFIENFGEAFIIGKYPPGADETFRLEIEEAVRALGRSKRGITPQGTDLEIVESKKEGGGHEAFVKYCDRGISITILGHANAVEDSTGMQVGQNLSAYQVKREIALSDIRFIEGYINEAVRMLVRRNFRTQNFPVFSIDKAKPIDVSERLKVLELAWNMGYSVSPEEFSKLGLFRYSDQEPLKRKVIK